MNGLAEPLSLEAGAAATAAAAAAAEPGQEAVRGRSLHREAETNPRGRKRRQEHPGTRAAKARLNLGDVKPSDSHLKKSIHRMLKQLGHSERSRLVEHMRRINKKLRTGSACSGSEIALVVNTIIMTFLKGEVENIFSCEKAPAKADFIAKVVEPFCGADTSFDEDSCCFKDILHLGAAEAECHKHGTACRVGHVHFKSTGFSCKNLSKLFSNKKSGIDPKKCFADKTGSSGETLDGLLAYVKSHSPSILVCENVDDLMGKSFEENHKYLLAEFRSVGYAAHCQEVVSTSYGCPQRRKRTYIVAYKIPPGWSYEAVMELAVEACALAESLQVPACKLGTFLLPRSDPYLTGELSRRQRHRDAMDESLLTLDAAEWRDKNRRLLERDGIAVSMCVVPSSHRQSPWYNILTPRQRMVLAHGFLTHGGAENRLEHCDVYQTMGREFVSTDPNVIPTIVPNSLLWMVAQERLMTGFEALRVQSFPVNIIRKAVQLNYSDSFLADLAGNMFTGTVYAAFAIAALVCAPGEVAPAAPTATTEAAVVTDVVGSFFGFM